jgi:virulence factor Mce-like protein
MRRRVRQRRRERGPVGVVLVAVTVIALAAALFALGLAAQRGIPGRSYYDLRGEFEELTTLTPHSEIRVAGRRVGQTLDARADGDAAVVDLQFDGDAGPLRSDTRLRIRPKGLLGAQYVDVVPGTKGEFLEEGSAIPASQTSASVQLSDIFQTLDRPHRDHLQAALRELGNGFAGRGRQLNAMMRDTPPLLRDLRQVAAAVNTRDGAAERFFPATESFVRAQDAVRSEIAQGFEPSARALGAFSDHGDALKRTLVEAPPALVAARAGMRRSEPLLRETTRLSNAVARSMRGAPASLAELNTLLRTSGEPLRRGRALLAATARAVPPATRLNRAFTPLLPAVADNLRYNVPGLRELAVHECDVLGFAASWRSMLQWGVPGGGEIGPLNVLRYEVVASDETATGAAVGEAPRSATNTYPEPCEAGTEKLP